MKEGDIVVTLDKPSTYSWDKRKESIYGLIVDRYPKRSNSGFKVKILNCKKAYNIKSNLAEDGIWFYTENELRLATEEEMKKAWLYLI